MTVDIEFILRLVALALIDALNPFTIAAQAYLLGTPKPMPRSIAFLLATFATYLAAGVLLATGAAAFFVGLRPMLPDMALAAGAIGLGLVCFGGAIWLWRSARRRTPVMPPQALSIGATIGFAVFATVTDVPTALPYFAAASMVASDGGSPLAQAGWLVLYNVLYVSPMLVLVVLRAFWATRVASAFASLQRAIAWTLARGLPLLAAGLGGWLFWVGIQQLAAVS